MNSGFVPESIVMGKLIYNFCVVCLAGWLTWAGLDVEVFSVFAVLLIFDYVTGVGKAKRLGHAITSNKMKYGVVSKLSLLIIPLTLGLAAKGMKMEAENVLYVGMNILILSEVYSIIGNTYSIRTKEELPEYDVLASFGKKIRNRLIKMEAD